MALSAGARLGSYEIVSPVGAGGMGWLYFQLNHLNIYRMPADGGRIQQVAHFPESGLFLEAPTISPDGRYLVYCRSNGGSSLWVLRLGNVHTGG